MHEALVGEQADRGQDLGDLDMIVVVAEEILNHFENLEQRQCTLDRLVNVEVLLTVINYVFQEIDELRQPLRLLLFLILLAFTI